MSPWRKRPIITAHRSARRHHHLLVYTGISWEKVQSVLFSGRATGFDLSFLLRLFVHRQADTKSSVSGIAQMKT